MKTTPLKYIAAIACLFGIGSINAVEAKTAMQAIDFKPYVDYTLSVHWDQTYQDLEPIDLVAMSKASGVKNFTLGFITDAGTCAPAWGGQSAYAVSQAWGSHVTDNMRANKIQYTVSLGGASGNDISMSCSIPQLVAAYAQIIKIYQPKGLDFDIENGTANVTNVMQALQYIRKAYPALPISFTLPVMPEGLGQLGQQVVTAAQKANLNFVVNIMAMDYGPSYVNDMGQYAIQAATSVFTYLKTLYPTTTDADLWHKIAVTPMIGVNDIAAEQFTLNNVDTLRTFAVQNNLAMLAMWSFNRDNPCASTSAENTCSGNNLQSKPYEFSQRFMSPN